MIPARRRDRLQSKQGPALVVVVLFLAAITVLLGSLLTGVNRTLDRGHIAWRDQLTRAVAEAGIERAVAQLAETSGTYSGEKDLPIGDGFCSIRVTKEKTPNSYLVVSVGELRDSAHKLRRNEIAARFKVDGARVVAIDWLDPAGPREGAS